MKIPEGASISTNPSPHTKQDGNLFSRCNKCNPPPCPPRARATQLLHTVAIIPRAPRMPVQDETLRPSIWRVCRLHDDVGDLWVVFNNQMTGPSGRRGLFYCTYDRHHQHQQEIIRNKMASREGPTRHLPQYAHLPLTSVWESHRSRIPFRWNYEHRHG